MIHVNLKLSETLFFKKNHYNLFYIFLIVFAISFPLQVFSHGDEEELEEELFILSRFIDGNIELSTNSEQWEKSFEIDYDSKWEHDISVKSLNNGTNVYFLLSWEDPTKGDDLKTRDGVSIIFESKPDSIEEHEIENTENGDEINEIWRWDASKPNDSSDIILDATWENQKWDVLFGRSVSTSEQDKITFESGIKQEGFLKIVVWDGSAGESIEQIDEEDLPHADFILLPWIDTYPKDVFVWSALLVVGAVSFLFVERKLHFKKEELE